MDRLTKKVLTQMAKDAKIPQYYKMNKAELIEALSVEEVMVVKASKKPAKKKKKPYIEIIEEKGSPTYSDARISYNSSLVNFIQKRYDTGQPIQVQKDRYLSQELKKRYALSDYGAACGIFNDEESLLIWLDSLSADIDHIFMKTKAIPDERKGRIVSLEKDEDNMHLVYMIMHNRLIEKKLIDKTFSCISGPRNKSFYADTQRALYYYKGAAVLDFTDHCLAEFTLNDHYNEAILGILQRRPHYFVTSTPARPTVTSEHYVINHLSKHITEYTLIETSSFTQFISFHFKGDNIISSDESLSKQLSQFYFIKEDKAVAELMVKDPYAWIVNNDTFDSFFFISKNRDRLDTLGKVRYEKSFVYVERIRPIVLLLDRFFISNSNYVQCLDKRKMYEEEFKKLDQLLMYKHKLTTFSKFIIADTSDIIIGNPSEVKYIIDLISRGKLYYALLEKTSIYDVRGRIPIIPNITYSMSYRYYRRLGLLEIYTKEK